MVNNGSSFGLLIEYILQITADERQRLHKLYKTNDQLIQCKLNVNNNVNLNNSCHVVALSNTTTSFQQTVNILKLYIYPIIILCGTIGNFLSFLIMCRNVKKGYPSSLYLTVLALVDFSFLLINSFEWLGTLYKMDFKLTSQIMCRVIPHLVYLTSHLSAGLVVTVTVERYIAVKYPLIAHKLNTIRNTKFVILILIIILFLLDSHFLFLFNRFHQQLLMILKPYHNGSITEYEYEVLDSSDCYVSTSSSEYFIENIWLYIDLSIYCVIPFSIIIILNYLIIKRLIDAQRFRQKMTNFNSINRCRYHRYIHRHQHYYTNTNYCFHLHSSSETKTSYSDSDSNNCIRSRRYLQQLSAKDKRNLFEKKTTIPSNISTTTTNLSFEMQRRKSKFYIEKKHEIMLLECGCNHHLFLNDNRKPQKHRCYVNNTKLTTILIFVSCSFLLLTLPVVVINIYIRTKTRSTTFPISDLPLLTTSIKQHLSPKLTLMKTIAKMLMIINHSINFILYFVLGKRFRRDLQHLFLYFCTFFKRKLNR